MDKATKTLTGDKAREAILKGANAVYDAVKLTLGPQGGNALMYRTYGRSPRITNDGVTISECIEPLNEFENLAAGALKEAAKRTNERVGDGTTATTVFAGHLLNETFRKLLENVPTAGKSSKTGVMSLKRKMLSEAQTVIEAVKSKSTSIETVEDLYKVAFISVEDKDIAKIIADIVWETGTDGFVDVVEGHKIEIETEVIKGVRFPAKVPGKFFVNNKERFEMVAKNAPVLVTDIAMDSPIQFVKMAEKMKLENLIILSPSFSDNVLVSMAASYKNGFVTYPVKVPSLRTEQFEDIAVACGAKFISKAEGGSFDKVTTQDLGFFEKLVVKDVDAREDAMGTGGKGNPEKIKERIDTLRAQITETKQEVHKKILERRIASIASAVGVIKVGAPSQAEQLYLLKKIEDAVYACRAAVEEGYVKGGGLTLKEIADDMPEDSVLKASLTAPYEQIQANAEEPLIITDDVVDPTKVVRLVVEHAVSVVAHLITVKIIVAEQRDRNPAEGYSDIALAINRYARFFAKDKNLITQAENDIWKENEENGDLNIMREQFGLTE